ncbi:MAG TPA: ABC transporter ATP-binding protein [Polyangiaceae bacterium]|jgi:ATP-binding cassette subfamily B protein|nr:ABC transporter ATP-binding protein [Polyangiaceae bacterium]
MSPVRQPRSVGQRPLDLGIIRRVFSYTKRHKRLRNYLFVLVLLRAAQLPTVTWAVGNVLSGPVARLDIHGTILGVAGFLAMVMFTETCFVFRMRFALRLGEAVVHDLRREVYAHLLSMPISFFKKMQVGRLIGRMTSDVDAVRTGVQDVAFVSTVQCGTMMVSAGLMIYYDWQLFLVVVVMAPILFGIIRHFRKKLSQAYRAEQESFSRVTATLAESVTGIKEIQGFVRQDINGGLFRQLIHDHSKYNMDSAKQSAVFLPMLEFNSQLFLSLLLVVGGYQTLAGHVELKSLIVFMFLSNQFFAGIPIIGNQYNQALTAMAGAERVFALLDTKPEWQDLAEARDIPAIVGRVEFQDLTFEYEPGRPVLHGITFAAEPGQTIALVGHTGSGKTSIVNLVAKLYLPSSGKLLIDGHDMLNVTSASLHRQIASVSQENFLFSGTVIENIRLGCPTASDDEVREAARALDVLDMIEDLSLGFQTAVGEKGSGLSLGQRQIVCFARAMLANPRILILDEATSSVDSVTESRLQQALARLLRGRTSFVVAHRLSTIRHANQVLVLDHGRIIERGTHTELLRKGGEYADMYRQFVSSADGDLLAAN